MVMTGEPTECGRSSQPHPVEPTDYRIWMGTEPSKAVLWANVSALMKTRYGKENLTRLAKEAGIGPGTASRIKAQETSVGVDVVDQIAAHFKVLPWQLLTPDFDAARTGATPVTVWPLASSTPGEVSALPSDQLNMVDGYVRGVLDSWNRSGNAHAA